MESSEKWLAGQLPEVFDLKQPDISGLKWGDICPVCKQSLLKIGVVKKMLLLKKEIWSCPKCGSEFQKVGTDMFKQTKGGQKYFGQTMRSSDWIRVAKGGYSTKEWQKIIQNKLDYLGHRFCDAFCVGEIPVLLTASNVVTKKGEVILFSAGAALVAIKKVRQGGGTYSGFSVRITKGVRWHVGGFNPPSYSEQAVIADNGVLTITNKRIIYGGTKKTTTIDLGKVVGIQSGNVLYIAHSKSQKPLLMISEPTVTYRVNVRGEEFNLETRLTHELIAELLSFLIDNLEEGGKRESHEGKDEVWES